MCFDTGCDVQTHLRQVSSTCETMEQVTTGVRTSHCHRLSISSSDSSSRLSDTQGEIVDLATGELLSALRQLRTIVTKLAWTELADIWLSGHIVYRLNLLPAF